MEKEREKTWSGRGEELLLIFFFFGLTVSLFNIFGSVYVRERV